MDRGNYLDLMKVHVIMKYLKCKWVKSLHFSVLNVFKSTWHKGQVGNYVFKDGKLPSSPGTPHHFPCRVREIENAFWNKGKQNGNVPTQPIKERNGENVGCQILYEDNNTYTFFLNTAGRDNSKGLKKQRGISWNAVTAL